MGVADYAHRCGRRRVGASLRRNPMGGSKMNSPANVMDQLDSQRQMQNKHSVHTITVIPGSKLEALLKKMEQDKSPSRYTTLDVVARQGCHAAVAHPNHG